MTRTLSLVIFLGIGSLLVGAIHYYLWTRLVRDVQWPPGWHRGLTWGVAILGASIPATALLGRALPRDWADILLKPSYAWMGIMFLLFVAVLVMDLGRGLTTAVLRTWSDAPDPERRLTLSRIFGLGAAMMGFGSSAVALYEGYRFHIRRVEVALARLPKELDGTRIVQISDLHVGPNVDRSFVAHVVAQVNALAPDLVAITGDLVDGTVEDLAPHVAPLADIQSRYGAFFVTGNHEYYSGVDEWCRKLGELNLRVLRNERVSIGDAAQFDLAGIDDFHAHRFGGGHGADLPAALNGRDETRELVLLAHQPRAVLEAEKHGVGLQLSGHTHGGQLWPFNWLVKLQQPVVSGLARVGRSMIYVSNGTGYWGPPMRLAAPAELTEIVLRSKLT